MGIDHAVTGSLSSAGSQFSERANFKVFKISKTIDIATPKLFYFCAKGEPLPKMQVHLCRATGEQTTYRSCNFAHCLVRWFTATAEQKLSQNLPMEEITFTVSKVTLEYCKTDHATAKLAGSGGKTFWDQTINQGGRFRLRTDRIRAPAIRRGEPAPLGIGRVTVAVARGKEF